MLCCPLFIFPSVSAPPPYYPRPPLLFPRQQATYWPLTPPVFLLWRQSKIRQKGEMKCLSERCTYVQTYANSHTHTHLDWTYCNGASAFVLLFRFDLGGHCRSLNTSICNDYAVCSQIKRLASLRHNLMDRGVLGPAWPLRLRIWSWE